MFSEIFNYDNPIWRFIGKFCDLLILNILWILLSIPVVTSGAATTAVYYVTLKLVRDEEGPTIRSFFRSFKENFRQATILWLVLLAVGGLLAFDVYFFFFIQKEPSLLRTAMIAIFGGFSLLYCFTSLYVFPLQARFYNPIRRTLFNALIMSVRHLLFTLGMLAVDVFLFFAAIFLLPVLMPFLVLFGFPLVAFINSYVLVKLFDRYMPQEDASTAAP